MNYLNYMNYDCILKYLNEQIAKREYNSIERAIESMEKTKKRLDANVRFDTALEIMFMYMKDK